MGCGGERGGRQRQKRVTVGTGSLCHRPKRRRRFVGVKGTGSLFAFSYSELLPWLEQGELSASRVVGVARSNRASGSCKSSSPFLPTPQHTHTAGCWLNVVTLVDLNDNVVTQNDDGERCELLAVVKIR